MKRRTLDYYPFVVFRVACYRCRRQGTYRLARLAERYGAQAPLIAVLEEIAKDCPYWYRRHAGNPVCGAHLCDLVDEFGKPAREPYLAALDMSVPRTPEELWPIRIEWPTPGLTEVVARASNAVVAIGAWEAAVMAFPERTVIAYQGGHRLRHHVGGEREETAQEMLARTPILPKKHRVPPDR